MVHHGNRGRWTSSGAGSTHRAYDWGRISAHPPSRGTSAATARRTRHTPCHSAASRRIADRGGIANKAGPGWCRAPTALVTSRVAAHAGFVTEQTGAEVRATAADAARQARGVLAALGDPDDGLTATPAMRNRIEGAALALETVAGGAPTTRR